MTKARLFTPGPTAVPDEVLKTQAQPLVHHRTQEFRDAYAAVLAGLKALMKTENPVVVVASSGTGAMEMSVVNLTRPGEKVIVTACGKFGERWRDIAAAYGMEAVVLEPRWGDPVPPERVEEAFAANPDASALLTTHSETSTGVLQDVEAFAKIAHAHDALIIVDGITSICAHDVRTDEWGLDAVVGGSQKGVMIPPGLGYLSVSPRALEKMKGGHHPAYYFDLDAAVKKAAEADSPYTPAISLVFALQRSLQMILDEGVDNVIARHARNASAVRAAVTAIGLPLLASVPSNATTAVVPPEGTAGEITKMMEHTHGVKIAGGQAHLKGKIVRLGHLGHYYEPDITTLIDAFEQTLSALGIVEAAGRGREALDAVFAAGGAP